MVSRRRLIAAALCAALAATVSVVLMNSAGAGASRCAQFRAAAAEPARAQMGTGTPRILVIGDSYSVGLGVDGDQSWPHRLPGRVIVAGFSGSGFSKDASGCGQVSYAARAAAGLRRAGHVDLVVVEGGLNDYDQPTAAIRAGFDDLLDELGDRPVVVVGPAPAPSRADAVPRIDALLARLSTQHGVSYVRMAGTNFPYLPDRLHLTPAGHEQFGDRVAHAIHAG